MEEDHLNLETLRRSVLRDIETYRYEASDDPVGNPWSAVNVVAQLTVMRAALVAPYWVEVELRDSQDQIAAVPAKRRACAVVADDSNGMLVAFDPIASEYLLIMRQESGLITIGVRGDAVGCFLSR